MENWKDVVGYEGYYKISDKGRIRSVDRYIEQQGRIQLYKGKLLSPFKNHNGYYAIRLSKNNTKKGYTIHRLVAMAFIPNPKNFPCVNHRDETQTNNCVENLEWCDVSYNMSYGTLPERRQLMYGMRVCMYTMDGKFLKTYSSARSVEKMLKINHRHIISCCNNECFSAGGYIWRHYEDTKEKDLIINASKNKKKRICQYDKNMKLIAVYSSAREAERVTGFKHENISACCRNIMSTCNGFYWAFEGNQIPKKKRYRPIAKYDLDMNLIEKFDNLEEACNSIGGESKRAGIKQCLYGKNKKAYGYIWKEIKK